MCYASYDVYPSRERSGGKENLEERKEKEPVKRATHVGRKLNKYTMKIKARMIELIEKDHKNCEIVKISWFPEVTVHNSKRQKSEIKASLGIAQIGLLLIILIINILYDLYVF